MIEFFAKAFQQASNLWLILLIIILGIISYKLLKLFWDTIIYPKLFKKEQKGTNSDEYNAILIEKIEETVEDTLGYTLEVKFDNFMQKTIHQNFQNFEKKFEKQIENLVAQVTLLVQQTALSNQKMRAFEQHIDDTRVKFKELYKITGEHQTCIAVLKEKTKTLEEDK